MGVGQLLIQFVFRLTFGVSWAMAVTPQRWVSSGYYRVHLWLLMGLNTFAGLAIFAQRSALEKTLPSPSWLLALAGLLIFASYAGSALWLYERRELGICFLYGTGVIAFLAAVAATPWSRVKSLGGGLLVLGDLASSGWLLGVTLAAMLLGHWYLNTPTMELLPLRRLLILTMGAILVRALVSATGLVLQAYPAQPLAGAFWIFVAFRWLAGLVGTGVLVLMAWYTLRVPNTQSATGILYAAVILAFLGELTSQLLSVDARYPL
jgi:hypothetical protein